MGQQHWGDTLFLLLANSQFITQQLMLICVQAVGGSRNHWYPFEAPPFFLFLLFQYRFVSMCRWGHVGQQFRETVPPLSQIITYHYQLLLIYVQAGACGTEASGAHELLPSLFFSFSLPALICVQAGALGTTVL